MSDTDDSEPSTSFSRRKKKLSGQLHQVSADESDNEDSCHEDMPHTSCGKNGGDGNEDPGSPVLENDDEEEDVLEGEDECETGDSDSSSGPPGAETCAICLGRIRGEVGSPEVCDHIFCLICILEWAKTNATCPQDRKPFEVVSVQECFGGMVIRSVSIKKEEKEEILAPEENPTYCEVCHECDREERLLLCDGCDLGYHLECLDPPLAHVPVEEWFCPDCASTPQVSAAVERRQQVESPARRSRETRRTETRQTGNQESQQRQQAPRRIPRTRATERVRARIQQHRRQVRAAKRRSRKQRKRERIENGEEEDTRPPVKRMSRFSFFVSGDDDIDAEHTEDSYATQVLSGECPQEPIYRDPATRRAAAARILHLNTYTPLPGYSGRAPATIIDRVDSQRSQSEGDVLDNILQRQSIALTTSKNLSLTSDGKLTSQGELEVHLPDTLGKEHLIMSEPLPSQRSPGREKNEGSKHKERDRRDDSSRREGESERRRGGYEDYSRKRDRDGDDRRQRDWEIDKRKEREGEEFRRRWRDGDNERKDQGRGYSARRGDRSNYGPRRDYYREDARYGPRYHPYQPQQSGRYFSHYESYRNRDSPFHQGSQQSPLEDKRRSPPRLSYQRPQGQYSHRRDRYQTSPPYRRNIDSYRDHRKDDRSSFKNRDSENGHRSFCRSNVGDQRDLGFTRNDSDYHRSSENARRNDGDFRRSDSSSRKSDSDFSRSDGESWYAEESVGARRRHSPTRKPEVDIAQHSRSSDERGHCPPPRQTTHHSRSRSPASRSRSRSNSRSPRRTERKGHSQVDSSKGRSTHDTHSRPVETAHETECSIKDNSGYEERENLNHGKRSQHDPRKDLFDSSSIEETERLTDKILEIRRRVQGRLETDLECSNELQFTSTSGGSMDAAAQNTQINSGMYLQESESVGESTRSQAGTNNEDESPSHSQSYCHDNKRHEHGQKKEGRERERREKKEAGSRKHHVTNLFRDDSDSSSKIHHALECDTSYDDNAREEIKDTQRKSKTPRAKPVEMNKKKSQLLKELFSDDEDEPATLSPQHLTKEKQIHQADMHRDTVCDQRGEAEEIADTVISRESMSLDKASDNPPVHYLQNSTRKEKPSSSHKSLFKDREMMSLQDIDKPAPTSSSSSRLTDSHHKDKATTAPYHTSRHRDEDVSSLYYTDKYRDTDPSHYISKHKGTSHHIDRHNKDTESSSYSTNRLKDKDIASSYYADKHKDRDTSPHYTDKHTDRDTPSHHNDTNRDKDSVASLHTDRSDSKRKDSSHSTGRKSLEQDVTSKEPKSKENFNVPKADDKSKIISLNIDDDLSTDYSHSTFNKSTDWFRHTLDIIKNYRNSKKKQSEEAESTSELPNPKPRKQDEARSSHKSNKNENSSSTLKYDSRSSRDSSGMATKVNAGRQKVVTDLFGDVDDIESSGDVDTKTVAVERHKKVEHKDKKDKDKASGKDVNSQSDSVHTEKRGVGDVHTVTSAADQEKPRNSSSSNAHSVKSRPHEKPGKKATDKSGSGSSKGGVKEGSGSQHLKPAQKAALEAKVVSEVKHWLDPHYKEKSITKPEYKEIVAKCVTKVVSAECGDIIESEKMRGLVEGYIKVYKHRRTKHQMQLLSPR